MITHTPAEIQVAREVLDEVDQLDVGPADPGELAGTIGKLQATVRFLLRYYDKQADQRRDLLTRIEAAAEQWAIRDRQVAMVRLDVVRALLGVPSDSH